MSKPCPLQFRIAKEAYERLARRAVANRRQENRPVVGDLRKSDRRSNGTEVEPTISGQIEHILTVFLDELEAGTGAVDVQPPSGESPMVQRKAYIPRALKRRLDAAKKRTRVSREELIRQAVGSGTWGGTRRSGTFRRALR
jgi:hypothetical protein